tara:strand:- start:68 stop:991 length:924 start_codon:yes stop_codon:yes gene_type:complete
MRLGATSLSVTKPGAVRKYAAASGGGGGGSGGSGTFPDLDTYSHVRFHNPSGLAVAILDVHLSADGTKAWYLLGNSLRTFYQRNLSTPFDISTMGTIQAQKDLRVSTNLPYRYIQDTYFKPDGTRLYGASYYGLIVTWTLSTAFDVSTASFSQSLTYAPSYASGPKISGVTFKPDGTVMYWADPQHDAIYQTSLSTAWDPTSAGTVSSSAYLNNTNTLTEGSPWGLNFSPDGTKLYILGIQRDRLFQANLSTPWDVTTSSWDGTADYQFDYTSDETDAAGFCFGGSSGQHLYIGGAQGDGIDQYVSS